MLNKESVDECTTILRVFAHSELDGLDLSREQCGQIATVLESQQEHIGRLQRAFKALRAVHAATMGVLQLVQQELEKITSSAASLRGPSNQALVAEYRAAADDLVDPASDAGGPRCESCQAPIIWLKTVSGKNMPVDRAPGVNSTMVFDGDKHTSHFATCPNAAKHRRKTPAH